MLHDGSPNRIWRWILILTMLLLTGAGARLASQTSSKDHFGGAVGFLEEAGRLWEAGKKDRAIEALRQAAVELSKLRAELSDPEDRSKVTVLIGDLTNVDINSEFTVESISERLALLKPELNTSTRVRFSKSYSPPVILDQSASGGHASAKNAPTVADSPDQTSLYLENHPPLRFEPVAAILEKTFCGSETKDHILETGGGGIALVDYDNDGWLDIFVVNAFRLTEEREPVAQSHLLYRNLGGMRFENVSRQAGVDLPGWGYGVCTGDYNNDGYLDLYVTNFGPNFLFHNNGDGTFSEVARSLGIDHPGWSTGCTFFDPDRDGNLDLYVANYLETDWKDLRRATRTHIWRDGPRVMSGPVGMRRARNIFYRNSGSGSFGHEGHLPADSGGYSLGVLSTDVNNDGWVDLYVANDSDPNYVLLNHQGTLIASSSSGAELSGDARAQAGMGVDAADIDSDGLMDLVVTNFAHDYNTLYRNLGSSAFEDVSHAWGLQPATFERLGWGVVFFDADLDGDLDFFIANGHLYPQVDQFPSLNESYQQANQLLINVGGRFVDGSKLAGLGLSERKSSRGLATGDLDNDGRMDLVISNMDDSPTILHNRSEVGDQHWITIVVNRPTGKNRFGIGARVAVEGGALRQTREIRSGGSYLSQNDLRAHFGLGKRGDPVDISVEIPGEGKWEWRNTPVDQIVSLTINDDHAR